MAPTSTILPLPEVQRAGNPDATTTGPQDVGERCISLPASAL